MLVLYHNEMSSSSQKVRLLLAEKGLDWESRPVNLRTGEQQEEWYRKLNPRAVVPTLLDGDQALQESTVINEYLEEKFPEPPLMEKDLFARAQIRLWTKQVDEAIHDGCIAVLAFAIAFRESMLANKDAAMAQAAKIPDPFKRERRRDVLERGLASIHVDIAIDRVAQLFDEMEQSLGTRDWLVGSRYTLADVAILPYVKRLEDLAFRNMIDARPHVSAWFARCKARPGFAEGVSKWENAGVLQMMDKAGSRPEVQQKISGR
jgi:glutathione S-transferase